MFRFFVAGLWLVLVLQPAAAAVPQAQNAALRLVVIEGADAVNVVQQKTAVSPVVEVRDRNGQPVAGAVVRFAIRSGRATFSGARNLSVVTNAAGRATAAGLLPTGNGALQISATAAFQGQTAAVTIAQTNVMTLAQAATVSTAGASGGGAGAGAGTGATGSAGGGGLSTTTVGIVGGAAAAGTAVAVNQLGGSAPVNASGQFSGVIVMTFPRQVPCSRNERHTGTITMRLTEADGAVTGTVSINATVVIDPSPCTPTPNTDTFGFDDHPFNGPETSLTFTTSHSNPFTSSTGNPGTNSYDYSFAGSRNNGVVTGTLTITRTLTGGDFPGVSIIGSVVHNVTIR